MPADQRRGAPNWRVAKGERNMKNLKGTSRFVPDAGVGSLKQGGRDEQQVRILAAFSRGDQ
jgi:hypothetical protein